MPHPILYTPKQNTISYTSINYGLLYNAYVFLDPKGIIKAPFKMYEVGTFNLLPNGSDAGGRLKEIGLIHWQTPNTGATDEIGYNWRGAGRRENTGTFAYLTQYSFIWLNEASGSNYYANFVSYNNSLISTGTLTKVYGCSIRAYKPDVFLANGTIGIYVGNDGKKYKTIVYNNNEFIIDHLAETKFNDGTDIPNVTDNTAWAALTTAAWCAYNNDLNNI